MRAYRLDHLSDAELTLALGSAVAGERSSIAAVLSHLAEFDRRRLYAPAGHPSLYAYCVERLHLSEGAAYKRILAARAARRFPEVFEAVAAGQLHLSAIVVLKRHLTCENAAELLGAASYQSKAAVEALIAARFPSSEVLPLVVPAAMPMTVPVPATKPMPATAPMQLSPGTVGENPVTQPSAELSPGTVALPLAPAPRVTPIAQDRFVLQLSMSNLTREKLEQLRELLSHNGGDLAEVLDYALEAGIEKAKKRKFGVTERPRAPRASGDPRRIPAHVRRAVHARDGGRCTFVGDDGHRCASLARLEFDHVEPVARGGTSTVDNLRLRCRTHNQLAAEQAFGVVFMRRKRDVARELPSASVCSM